MQDTKSFYDQHYSGDYRETLSGFEISRWDALAHFIPEIARIKTPESILDYGSGSGLYLPLWKSLFPNARIYNCDISSVALEKLKIRFPDCDDRCSVVDNYKADFADELFDAVFSVEVMEHIDDLTAYFTDIYRLLKPGGKFIWTTPCANALSIEHIYYNLTGGVEKTPDGYRRWKSEAPEHVRRLTSGEVKSILERHNFENVDFRFRSHFFSFICTFFWPKKLRKFGDSLMKLDYRIFRRLPNGASMLGVAQKPSFRNE